MSIRFLLPVLMLSFLTANAQTDYSLVYDSDDALSRGVALHQEGQYAEALTEFEKVDKIDPQYLNAKYERVLSLSMLDRDDEVKNILEEAYANKEMQKFPMLYTLYGSYLSDEKKYEESEKIFAEGLKYLNNSSNYLFNYALLQIRKENRQKGIDLLKQSITINPNHVSSHYFLGILAMENGNITEGTLALLASLVLAPAGGYANDAILKINAKFGENFLEKGKMNFSASGDDFSEIDVILRNQLALKPAYKVKSAIDEPVIRQAQAVAEYAATHEVKDGFFETTYIPWLANLYKTGHFEGFSYYMLISMEDKLGKKLTSQKKKITSFVENYIQKDFWNSFAQRKVNYSGSPQTAIVTLRNSVPYLVGPLVNGKKEGAFRLYDSNGLVEGELNFKDDLIEGVQKYYEKGKLTDVRHFSKGNFHGEKINYFPNGSVSSVETYKDGVLAGVSTSYYVNGGQQCQVTFVDGERDGKWICKYFNGGVKSDISYNKGKLNGPYTLYNEVGDITMQSNFVNDLLEGERKEYFDGKVLESEAVYKAGKIQGSFKRYHTNGALAEEYVYVNGKISSSKEFTAQGKLTSETLYNDKEQMTSYSYFDADGKKYFEEKYANGEWKSNVQYSAKGKPVEMPLAKKTFVMKDLDDHILANGQFDKNKKTGEWQYYNANGALKSKDNFKNGLRHGLSTSYRPSGYFNVVTNFDNDTIHGLYERYDGERIESVSHVKKGVLLGPFRTFYPDGKLMIEGYRADDEVNFEKVTYRQNGKVYLREFYHDGALMSRVAYDINQKREDSISYLNRSGKFTLQRDNGMTVQNYDMKNGFLDGKSTIKTKDGKMVVNSEFVNGVRHNNYKAYSPTGAVSYEADYYAGNLHGTEKTYDMIGTLKLTDQYTFGKEHGTTTRFYHNGKKMHEYNQFDGDIEGDHTYYNMKGEPIVILGYVQNQLKYFIRRNAAGELSERVDVINQTADITSSYPNGKPAAAFRFEKGMLQGPFAIYNSDGKAELTVNYKNGLLEGERTEYFANGKIYRKEKFTNNNYDGLQEYFLEDGKPRLTAMYVNDELHGDVKIYEGGKLAVTQKYDSNDLINIVK